MQLLPLFIVYVFFSGAEVALFSLDKKKLPVFFSEGSTKYRYLSFLLETPRRLLITFQSGKVIVVIMATALVTINISEMFPVYFQVEKEITLFILVILISLLFYSFGEVLAKLIAYSFPVQSAGIVAIPLYWLHTFLFPLTEICYEAIRFITNRIFFKGLPLTQEEIQHIASVGHEQGTLDEDEHELIKSVVEYKTTMVRELIIHRTEIEAIPGDLNFDELLESIRLAKHSRLPVYKESIDDIYGVIYAKDLLPYLNDENKRKNFSLDSVVRKPLIVPETKLVNEMMKEFQEKKMHIAVVVDEFGGTAGIITLEDIIQEVVGELRDELESGEPELKKIKENEYIIDASVSIEEFAEEFSIEIPDERDFDTVGGWLLNQLEQIPKEGDYYEYGDLKISILKTENNRILQIKTELRS